MASDTNGTVARIGRPVTLTDEISSMICERVSIGLPQGTAAVASGVPRRTFQTWLAKGRLEEAEEPYRSFAEQLELALSIFHESRVRVLDANIEDDVKVAMWQLERRFREDWGDPRRDLNINLITQEKILESPEWKEILGRVMGVLQQFPDALSAVAVAFAGDQPEEPRRELTA